MSDLTEFTEKEVKDSMVEVVCQDCKDYYYIDQYDIASDSGVCGICELRMITEDENQDDTGQQADVAYHQHVDTQMERM